VSKSAPGLDQEANRILMSHRDAATEIPDGEFRIADLDYQCVDRLVRRLIDTTAIQVRTVITTNGDSKNVYELSEMAKQRRESIIQNRYSPLDCDHSGIRNIDSETFECCWDPCNETYDRSEVDLDA